MATLVLDRITKSFGEIKALDNVSLDCKEGEFLVIVGPSGAGKTTTLNCIAGIEYPEFASVLIDGEDVTDLNPEERDVAMVFEDYALYPQLSVYDNLAFPLRSPRYKKPEAYIKERVYETTEMLGIGMLLERLPKQLSQGQRQRVSFGRALVRDPKLFLLDEPISHLDAKLRNAMRRELKRLRANLSQTIVYVTHDYLEALSLADRVVVLHTGKVLQFDETRVIYDKPATIEVGQLFGELPMIFFNGSIAEDLFFVDESGEFRIATEGYGGELSPGDDVILALRPTDLALVEAGKGEINGEVYSVQNQFDKKLVTISAIKHLLDVIVPVTTSIAVGDKAGIRISPEICFYFDEKTHKAL